MIFPLIIALYSIPVLAYHGLYLLRPRYAGLVRALTPALYGLMLAGIVLNSGRPGAFIYFQF